MAEWCAGEWRRRDGTGRDGTGRNGTGRDGTGRDGTGRVEEQTAIRGEERGRERDWEKRRKEVALKGD